MYGDYIEQKREPSGSTNNNLSTVLVLLGKVALPGVRGDRHRQRAAYL